MRSNLINAIYTKKYIEKINKKNRLLGISYNYDLDSILQSGLLICIFTFIIVLMISKNLLLSIFLTILSFKALEYFFFDLRLQKRSRVLEKESTFYFEILSLTLETGSNLKNAIELTCKTLDNNLSKEFQKVIEDIDLGKSLSESLNDLKLRIPSDTVNNIILNLLEANIYGTNMIDSLNNQLNYLNDKLLLETKGKINKMPIKISIVSVLIFVPLIMIIILGPIIINLLNS